MAVPLHPSPCHACPRCSTTPLETTRTATHAVCTHNNVHNNNHLLADYALPLPTALARTLTRRERPLAYSLARSSRLAHSFACPCSRTPTPSVLTAPQLREFQHGLGGGPNKTPLSRYHRAHLP